MIECKPKIQGKSNRISHILQNQCDWKILFQSHMLHTWYIGKTWWFLYSIHLGTNRKCTMEFWFVPRCFQCFQCSKMEFIHHYFTVTSWEHGIPWNSGRGRGLRSDVQLVAGPSTIQSLRGQLCGREAWGMGWGVGRSPIWMGFILAPDLDGLYLVFRSTSFGI